MYMKRQCRNSGSAPWWASVVVCTLLLCAAGCGDADESSSSGRGEGPVKLAEFARHFAFSAQGDTLWLRGEDGVWLHWSREGDSGESVNVAPGKGIRLPAGPLALATWSTTHAPHITAIGATSQWVATGYLDRVAMLDDGFEGALKRLGGDEGLDEEALVASGADVLTSYPFGDPMQGVEGRTGIPVMPLREYEEPHPLGRAEYIKVFGWLTGRMDVAEAVFRGIADHYREVGLMGAEAARTSGSPTVFTGSEREGKWTAPAGDGLMARLVQDAGGRYLLDLERERALSLRRVGSNIEMDLEQFALLAADADAWGKVVHAPDGWSTADARKAIPWFDVEDKLLFHCNTADVDYFGQAVLEPHLMLADLYSLLHGRPHPEGGAVYFHETLDRP